MNKKSEVVYFKYHHLSKWIFIFFILFSCSGKTNISKDFDNYLAAFDESIPESEHFYVILSKYACQSCLKSLLPIFVEKSKNYKQDSFTYIVANSSKYSSLENLKAKVINDKKELISRLTMNISDFTIIKTNKHKIIKVLNFGTTDYDKFLLFLNTELR
ncbi:MAG: hypothetical protein J7K39_03015 [Bacteroidales bacterium]|nr:hypothetical protein [Bacteroidales bacterium]